MSETTQTVVDTTSQEAQATPMIPFDFDEVPVQTVVKSSTAVTEEQSAQVAEPTPPTEPEEEIVDANEYLKNNLGFESWDEAKKQIEELKQKAQTPQEVKFANDTSKQFYDYLVNGKEEELLNVLSQKRKVESLISQEVTEHNAADFIKFSMQQKYKDLTQDEIDYKFNKQYSIPEKPIKVDEFDEDYDNRLAQWERQVQEVKKEMAIDAKLSKPEIQKVELVLPEISAPTKTTEPTQEELDAQKKLVEKYLTAVDTEISNLKAFETVFKDEEVEIPLSYNLSDDEKKSVSTQLKGFIENNFDANTLFAQRWVDSDGNLKLNQVAKDLALLQSENKISQKFVNEAAQKRLAEFIKNRSNIDIKPQAPQGTFNPEAKDARQKLADTIWDA